MRGLREAIVTLWRRPRWLRAVIAVVGLGVLVGGVVALFSIDNSAGSLFLVTLGTGLILIAVLDRRLQLEAVELLGARIKVREVVRSRLELAEAVDSGQQHGDSGVRDQAVALQTLARLYDLYQYVRRTQPFSRSRTHILDQLAQRMQAVGRDAVFDPAEVSTWFHDGDDALRVVALNLMLAREECRDFFSVLKAIDEPHSNFEQYYGLRLAATMVDVLDDLERQLLANAIETAQRTRRFRRDPSLPALGGAILARLDVD